MVAGRGKGKKGLGRGEEFRAELAWAAEEFGLGLSLGGFSLFHLFSISKQTNKV